MCTCVRDAIQHHVWCPVKRGVEVESKTPSRVMFPRVVTSLSFLFSSPSYFVYRWYVFAWKVWLGFRKKLSVWKHTYSIIYILAYLCFFTMFTVNNTS